MSELDRPGYGGAAEGNPAADERREPFEEEGEDLDGIEVAPLQDESAEDPDHPGDPDTKNQPDNGDHGEESAKKEVRICLSMINS